MTFINICGPVVANTVYVGGKLVAKDTTVTLPEVTPMTADLAAMGTLSMPIWQMFDNMEVAITKIGLDLGLRSMITPAPISLEVRFVQTVTDANGTTKNVGCKAFIKCIPTKIPGITVTPGEASENEITASCTRYQLIVDGTEYLLVDRLACVIRVAGADYTGGMSSML